ncbi:methyl-accepting chemotaxis protein [Rheinheimera sp. MM224]|uniref:methyl-accepting chemotaxis protein n=1 Tax=Rheinheimera sp. MM224 TaxID=3019969 RepID=UPI0021F88CC1|nr:methyl-accepting chemotaxis protein [Rheinheimera sp. MM224]CAI3793032.1 IS66 family transposase ISPsy43 [Rheinheimera sp. MM224]
MINTLTAPAVRLSRALSFKGKFLLIFAASIIPGLLLLGLSMLDDLSAIDRDKTELLGKKYIEKLTPVSRAISDHRASTALVLNGDDSVRTKTHLDASAINEALAELAKNTLHIQAEQWQAKISEFNSKWKALDQQWSGMSASENSLAHIELIGLVTEFRHHVAGDTGLLLDPDASTYYLMITAVDSLPALSEQLQQLRGSVSSIMASGQTNEKRLGRMESTVQRELPRMLQRINNDLELASDVDPEAAVLLQQRWSPVAASISSFSQQLINTVLGGEISKNQLENQLQQLDALLLTIMELESFMTERLEAGLLQRIDSEWLGFYKLLAFGLSILFLVGWLIAGFARDLTNRAKGLEQDMASLAAGDFSAHVRDRGDDELSRVAQSAASLSKQLGSMMQEIKDRAIQLMQAANNIAATSSQLANSSEEQSQASTSMAAAMEELTVSVSHMAENAEQARLQTEESGKASVAGSKVIHDTVQSMQSIALTVKEASGSVTSLGNDAKAISSIVDVIRAIAEQTNLLALNAAIEAARAGESGRGFAVVADEVRSLAARTATSTSEISQMIARIQTGTALVVNNMEKGNLQVEQGVVLASEAGQAIASISKRSGMVEQMVQSMTVTLNDQAAAAAEVAMKVESIAQMSNENTQATQSSARTAEDLRAVATELDDRVSQFKF